MLHQIADTSAQITSILVSTCIYLHYYNDHIWGKVPLSCILPLPYTSKCVFNPDIPLAYGALWQYLFIVAFCAFHYISFEMHAEMQV